MRDALTAGIFVAALALPICARADFVVSGQATAHTPETDAPQPAQSNQKADEAVSIDTAPSHTPIRPRFMVAQGFGDAVPLRFAVRQIVPVEAAGRPIRPDRLRPWDEPGCTCHLERWAGMELGTVPCRPTSRPPLGPDSHGGRNPKIMAPFARQTSRMPWNVATREPCLTSRGLLSSSG